MRTVSGQSGYCGQNLEVHFGLADAAQIDSLIILWPSGQTDVMGSIPANQTKLIRERTPSTFFRINFRAKSSLIFEKDTASFLDLSISNENEPLQSWEWDFDNDGVIDATDQNPVWHYDTLGIYSVRLSASNGLETRERLFENYMHVQGRPGIVVSGTFPTKPDTLIEKGERIAFEVFAEDSSGYSINHIWFLNGVQKSTSPIYNYRASSFNVPRFDTVRVEFSNGFDALDYMWVIEVREDVSSIDQNNPRPFKFALRQNYPNPFNPSTRITYELKTASYVKLIVYDALGREIKTLTNAKQAAGKYAVHFNAPNLSSGIYYYRIATNTGFTQIRKLVLLK